MDFAQATLSGRP